MRAADTLVELRAMLPPGLTVTERQLADPPVAVIASFQPVFACRISRSDPST